MSNDHANDYTEYDHLDLCEVPLSVYAKNLKRVILLSSAAYTEVGNELGVILPIILSNDIVTGPSPSGRSLQSKMIGIEPRVGNTSLSPSALDKEEIVIDIVIRAGQEGSPSEQFDRCAGYLTVVKRIIKKLIHNGQLDELTKGWPAFNYDNNSENDNESYVSPHINYKSIEQFPVAQNKEADYGYSAGIRLTIEVVYEPYLPN